MKLRLLALAATAATALVASGASAATYSISTLAGVHISQPLITDFNSADGGGLALAPGYSFDQGPEGLAFTRDGGLGLASGVSAPPPADNLVPGAFYETVLGNGGSATLTADTGIYNFQFYMGSPDDYNRVVFTFADGATPLTLQGKAIWGGNPDGNGDQSQGFTVSYHFNDAVKTVNFTSGNQNAFEFDKLAGGVPEPASWALMIIGFGGAGAALRGRRRMAGTIAA
ncbi:PEPxxWA-CTERM sorting domain-containing protein [Phenylobacterium sp.]|uniref:PEPxxWA-CTERM sorting domain-containing protein n=1 Tax=Phenylobacterium sp. TaxID=1871053 RepID=UPI002C6B1E2E|nr:PEPxxWA-CTERM sorting domain-containing protein [Phenylobacterium sp.]HLZ74290.1 PEPxxWA-CTERM sorting domain-containing protein [Phenylobacterium sp.]